MPLMQESPAWQVSHETIRVGGKGEGGEVRTTHLPCIVVSMSSVPSTDTNLSHLFTGICSDGDVRIVGGQSALQGRVEVCVSERYGTVCDAGFGREEASVVCGQLGFSRISKHYIRNIYLLLVQLLSCYD